MKLKARKTIGTLAKYLAVGTLLVVAWTNVSCKKEDTATFYEASPKKITSTDEGMTADLEIRSNSEWTLFSENSWITLSATSGSGSQKITVTIARNKSTEKREGRINVAGHSGSTVTTVFIEQAGMAKKVDNIIMAHRGAYKEYGHPDNSMAALKQAIELGVYGSECDINITSDGQVIVVHGETFGGLPILYEKYSTLQAKAKLKNGESLPLLEDFLKAVKEGYGTKLVIDVKSLSDEGGGNAQSIKAGVAAAKLIKRMGVQERVMFIVGRIAVFNGVIDEVGGEWPVAYMNAALTPEDFLKSTKGKTKWGNFDITGFGKNPETGKFDPKYTDDLLKKWNDAGVELSFYNIDTEDQIQWYLPHKENVKACSNYPLQLLQRVGKR